ncbi:hypothetical protein [Pseudomonas corrugata]|uniref:hypothetical protein n=1 Tax=Pseudomonas corrugata TaxID=47879 RepID=UPI0006D89C6F|nr:hypothetical protein [Pseudomonas corrugata]
MSARDRNAARYRLSEGLERWHRRWLLEGVRVRCLVCQAEQDAQDAGAPFSHLSQCVVHGEFAQHPWRDLAELLHDLPAVPA